ncbi:hypothetical protein E2562_004990 [Oryza meyeriana var. granulata]|uniref:Uncharacterized protein n=1 Tax=Oryza meyeriana var. granulata TaxID=110450 RepID=A0A6G1C630_9ORYZ|nr:hypothetical protein E2562_004990 [Oryza meyeriana var. granulata]
MWRRLRLRRALAAEREEAIAAREEAEKAVGLKSQQALFDAFTARACACIQQVEDRKLELARREGAVAKHEAAIARREEATRASEARQL